MYGHQLRPNSNMKLLFVRASAGIRKILSPSYWHLQWQHLIGALCGFRAGCKQAPGTAAKPSCAMQHAASAEAVGKSNAAVPGSCMPKDLPMHAPGHQPHVAEPSPRPG